MLPKVLSISTRLPRLSSICALSANAPVSSKEPELLHIDEQFRKIPKQDRNKTTFHNAVTLFQQNGMRSRGHVEFLNTALKYLKEYNLHKDLDTYKALLKVFPKGPLIPTNSFQKMFQHYPLQQHCCVRILDQMEYNGVQPDKEIHEIVANAFGEWNFATRKIKRMLYWMPKLKYSNKYLDRRDIEGKKLNEAGVAKVALKMICRDPGTTFTYIKTGQSTRLENAESWIVSGQSPLQRQLIKSLPSKSNIYVDGPYLVYVLDQRVAYFVLSAPPSSNCDFDEFEEQRDIYDFKDIRRKLFSDSADSAKNLHQQNDQTILALAVFEDNTDDMASKWVNHLIDQNSKLADVNVLFRVRKNEVGSTLEDEEEEEAASARV